MPARVKKKQMPCNKPRKSPNPKKKRVVKACQNGKEKIIHYGASGYGHNINKAARKSFRARHGCDKKSTKKNKLSARYWACKDLWTAGGKKKTTGTKGRVAKKRRRRGKKKR
tara:strand:- start:1882 stop:2217 length:336 start_codon:yes stop_codon:yes gene_type:complete